MGVGQGNWMGIGEIHFEDREFYEVEGSFEEEEDYGSLHQEQKVLDWE